MSQYKGQVALKDGGFYLREAHIDLLREDGLIAGCTILFELPPKLRRAGWRGWWNGLTPTSL